MRVFRHVIVALAICFAALPALAALDCSRDSDVRWFISQRDREEATLLAAWINGQLKGEQIVPISAQIMAWETRFARSCQDTAYVAERIHLLTLEGVTVEAIPARLFLATMERAGMRGLTKSRAAHRPGRALREISRRYGQR